MDIQIIAKEAEMHGQIQMIEGQCRALFNATDGKLEMTEGVVEAMHDICKQILDSIKKYYSMEEELRKMK